MKNEVQQFVGKKGTILVGGLMVGVRITDVKMAWGKLRFEVSPLAGSGSVWVESVDIEDSTASAE